MTATDLVVRGTVLTVDDAQPTAEALAVADGRIVAVATRADVDTWIGPGAQTLDLGDGCVMPGLVEAHGHPLMEAIVLSERMVDIRPVTRPSSTAPRPARSAVATGMRISVHNDPPVTPEEPLRNISVAATRTAPSGR